MRHFKAKLKLKNVQKDITLPVVELMVNEDYDEGGDHNFIKFVLDKEWVEADQHFKLVKNAFSFDKLMDTYHMPAYIPKSDYLHDFILYDENCNETNQFRNMMAINYDFDEHIVSGKFDYSLSETESELGMEIGKAITDYEQEIMNNRPSYDYDDDE